MAPPSIESSSAKVSELDFLAGNDSRVFRTLVAGLSALTGLYMLIRWAAGSDLSRAVAPYIVLGGSPLVWWINRRGHVRTSFVLYFWLLWLAVTVQAMARAGISNPVLHGYMVLMLLGGWALGLRHGFALGGAAIVASGVMAWAQYNGGWVPTPPADAFAVWTTAVLIWTAGLLLMALILPRHWRQFARAHDLNQQLEASVAQLEARTRELERSENRYERVRAAAPVPIAITRLSDGKCFDVNPAWEQLFGWKRADALGATSLELNMWVEPAAREAWISGFRENGRTTGHQARFRTRTGALVDARMYAEPVEYDGERYVLVQFLDDTERVAAQAKIQQLNEVLETRVAERTQELAASNRQLTNAMAELQRAQDELVQSEKLSSLGRLVAGVAHELNTPIGNALTAATTMHDAVEDFRASLANGALKRSALTQFVDHIGDGADLATRSLRRAADLVSSFKKVAIDQSSERRRRFNLAETVNEVIDTLRPSLKGQPWKIDVQIAPDIVLESYPGPLDQVLINLILNATLHAFTGRSEGSVRIAARPIDSARIELVCADDGVGIAPENLARVFDPFYTTRLGQGGSGLGLTIVHRLVTGIMGGTIVVESSAGRGAQFIMVLPLVAPKRAV